MPRKKNKSFIMIKNVPLEVKEKFQRRCLKMGTTMTGILGPIVKRAMKSKRICQAMIKLSQKPLKEGEK